MPILFAVDGGGTACRAAVVTPSGRIDATSGAANVASDRQAAIDTIRRLLAELAARAGLGWADLQSARGYLGLAGVMSVADGRAVAHALDLPRAQVADDQASTIAGALGDADGAVCAIGTGSFVGRQADGRVTRLGGWGFHLGDQASGAWLGRMLLTRACLAQDGILPASPLLTRVLAQDFGPGGHVAFQFRATPADYAALAPQVTGGDDPAARALLAEGAAYLTAALAALGWQQGQTLCLTGGVGPAYAALLPPSVPPRGNALDGALALAAREPAA